MGLDIFTLVRPKISGMKICPLGRKNPWRVKDSGVRATMDNATDTAAGEDVKKAWVTTAPPQKVARLMATAPAGFPGRWFYTLQINHDRPVTFRHTRKRAIAIA